MGGFGINLPDTTFSYGGWTTHPPHPPASPYGGIVVVLGARHLPATSLFFFSDVDKRLRWVVLGSVLFSLFRAPQKASLPILFFSCFSPPVVVFVGCIRRYPCSPVVHGPPPVEEVEVGHFPVLQSFVFQELPGK